MITVEVKYETPSVEILVLDLDRSVLGGSNQIPDVEEDNDGVY